MAFLDLWDRCAAMPELWWTRHGLLPAHAIASHRLQALVDFARAHSPFYRRLYRDLCSDRVVLQDLPVVRKPQLMAAFDEWATDRAITRAAVERFIATRPVGERFLDRYVVFQSSGTTGTPGDFVQADHALV